MAKVITFDGHDGTGKTTIVSLLCETLESKKHNTIILSPMQGFLNDFRKENYSTNNDIWFYFASWLLLEKKIELIQRDYDYVLVDRSYFSTIVLARAKDIPFPTILIDSFLRPNFMIWTHVKESIRIARLKQKGPDRIDILTIDKQLITKATLEYEKLNIFKVDTNLPPQQIVNNLLKLIL